MLVLSLKESNKALMFTFTEDNNFVVLVHGSEVQVHKMEDETLLPCIHELQDAAFDKVTTGGVMSYGGDFIVVICGTTIGKDSTSCFTMNGPTAVHQISGDQLSPRIGAASLVTDNGVTLWVTGGSSYGQYPVKTTEFLTLGSDGFSSKIGPDLSHGGIKDHCLVATESTAAMVIGGRMDSLDISRTVELFDFNLMKSSSVDPLLRARSKHACGMLKDSKWSFRKVVAVAGGEFFSTIYTYTVELFWILETGNYIDPRWEFGPDLPMPLGDAASVTTADQSYMFVIGGMTDNDIRQELVHRLQCFDMQCSWKAIDHVAKSLTLSRGLAMGLPAIPMSHRNISKLPHRITGK